MGSVNPLKNRYKNPTDSSQYVGDERQRTDAIVAELAENERRKVETFKKLAEDPRHIAKRKAYAEEKNAKLERRKELRAERDAELAQKRTQAAIKKAVMEASKAEKIANEKAEQEEFIELSKKTDLDSLVLAYYKHLQNPKFLDFAISTVPQILPHLDENLSLNCYGETFFKHEKAYMDNMPKLVEKFGYNKVASLLYRAYLHSDIKYNKLLSETKDGKQQALLIWGKIFDNTYGLIKVSEFSKLDEDEKVALFKGLGKEFVEENKSRLIFRYKAFIKALPKEFKNCTSILELQKEAQSVNKERFSNR